MGDYEKYLETDWQCDCYIKAWNPKEETACLYCSQIKKSDDIFDEIEDDWPKED